MKSLSIFCFVLACSSIHGHRGLEGTEKSLNNNWSSPIRRVQDQTCTNLYSDNLRRHWDEISEVANCTELNDTKSCTSDFSTIASNEAYDEAQHICEGDGGDLYTYDAVITCSGGSVYTFVKDILCFENCNESLAQNITQVSWTASEFVDDRNKICTWEALLVNKMEERNNPSDGDDQFLSMDDDNNDDNYSLPCIEHYTQFYWNHWLEVIDDDKCTFVNEEKHCVYNFTSFVASGAFDEAQSQCEGYGGKLYSFDATIDCPDGSSHVFVNDVLQCYSECNARSAEHKILSELAADEFLISAGEDTDGCFWVNFTSEMMGESSDNSDELMTCIDHNEDFYWDYWEEVPTNGRNCTYSNDVKNCTYNFTEIASNRAFENAQYSCKVSGGDLYTVDAVITCPDGSSFTFVNDLLSCLSDCNETMAKNTWSADDFLVGGNQTNCIWESFNAEIMEYDPMECKELDGDSYWDHWDDILPNCTYPNGSRSCIFNFTSIAFNGGFDKPKAQCKESGGELYTFDAIGACPSGSLYHFVNDILHCYSECDEMSAKVVTQYVWSADDFINSLGVDETNCTWDYFIVTGTEDEDDDGIETDDITQSTMLPSTSPTDDPTIYTTTSHPTMNPIMTPTPPDSSCNDSPLMFLVHDIPRCCKWVSRNPEERCNEMWGKGAQLDIDVKSHCPKSCAVCEDFACVDTVGKFVLDDDDKECNWLDSLDELERQELCSERRIHMTCKNTCSFCSE